MVIPFFSLLVKDLYFENEGCATLIPTNGHLNFEKFDRLGQRLSEFALWKNVECPYEKTTAIADYLQCYPILSEEGKFVIFLKEHRESYEICKYPNS